jgi:hypothetical protein
VGSIDSDGTRPVGNGDTAREDQRDDHEQVGTQHRPERLPLRRLGMVRPSSAMRSGIGRLPRKTGIR